MATDFTFNFDSVEILFGMFGLWEEFYFPVFFFSVKNGTISEELWNSVLDCIGMCVNHSPQVL